MFQRAEFFPLNRSCLLLQFVLLHAKMPSHLCCQNCRYTAVGIAVTPKTQKSLTVEVPSMVCSQSNIMTFLSYFDKGFPRSRAISRLDKVPTTLQSKMNAKLSPQRFWACHENGLIKTIQTIPHNLYVSFKLTSLYCGLRIILVYPNPQ